MLRRIFVPRTTEVTGGWRKLYNGGFRACIISQCYEGDETEADVIGEQGARMGEKGTDILWKYLCERRL